MRSIPTLAEVADAAVLDRAFDWLCDRRKRYPASSDVWDFRRSWPDSRRRIKQELRAGTFRFGLLDRIERDGETIELWASRDALVLKALTLVLTEHLPVSRRCAHVAGHGGAKRTVREVASEAKRNAFVLRTDVRSYYASIQHGLLLSRLEAFVSDRGVLDLIARYLSRTSERGGLFYEHRQGISLGCPLSPLMGAFFLGELDEAFAKTGLFYRRFMDDVIVLAPTRWKLRRAVKMLNEVFASLELDKHPDKTFIGKVERGFDFLGYQVSPKGLAVSAQTRARFVERATRLQERERAGRELPGLLGSYVRRWLAWVRTVAEVDIDGPGNWHRPAGAVVSLCRGATC